MKCISKGCYNDAEYRLDFCEKCLIDKRKKFRDFLKSNKQFKYKHEDKK